MNTSTPRPTQFLSALTAPYYVALQIISEPASNITPNTSLESLADMSEPTADEDGRHDDSISWPTNIDPKIMFQPIYKPTGKWGWINGLPIIDSELKTTICSEDDFSIHLKTGTAGDRDVTYISKCWTGTGRTHGFFSELALYKVQLKPLQGLFVPTIIGVYSNLGRINVAMQPPHRSFWIEASSDMPFVLKKRCVEAFEAIHANGVCHGNIKLSNMLIGADARVTIINFQNSRCLIPNRSVRLAAASSAELRMEMRKIKFQLEYEDARQKEDAKYSRFMSRTHSFEKAHPIIFRELDSEIQAHVLEGDEEDPPVETYVRQFDWFPDSNIPPKRFVTPGQTTADLELEIKNFLSIIDRLEAGRSQSTPLSIPPPPPTGDDRAPDPDITAGASSKVLEERYNLRNRGKRAVRDIEPLTHSPRFPVLRKRKNVPETCQDNRPAKRLRFNFSPDNGSPAGSSHSLNSFIVESRHTLDAPVAGLSSHHGLASSSSEPTSHGLFPLVKVHDYAYGPRPSSKQQIIDANIRRCIELGLPHPDAFKLDPNNPRWKDPDIVEYIRQHNLHSYHVAKSIERYPGSPLRMPRAKRAEGSLKRAMKDIVSTRKINDALVAERYQYATPLGKRKSRSEDESNLYQSSNGFSGMRRGLKVQKISGTATALDITDSPRADSNNMEILGNPGSRSGFYSINRPGFKYLAEGRHEALRSYSSHAAGAQVTVRQGDEGLYSKSITGVSTYLSSLDPEASYRRSRRTALALSQSSGSKSRHHHLVGISRCPTLPLSEKCSTLLPVNNLDIRVTVTPPYAGLLARCMGGFLRLVR